LQKTQHLAYTSAYTNAFSPARGMHKRRTSCLAGAQTPKGKYYSQVRRLCTPIS